MPPRPLFLCCPGQPEREYYLLLPANLSPGAEPLVLIHGISRNAPELVLRFAGLANRLGVPLIAPLFRRESFGQFQQVIDPRSGQRGGIAVMTGYSAKVDETAKWFETPLPGGLTELFGVRTNAFDRAGTPLRFTLGGQQLTGSDPYFEVLEPQGAKVLARLENVAEKSPAVTVNQVGKGKAIYLAAAAQSEFLGPLVRSLYAEAGIARGPATPAGVVARVVEGRTLYVNTGNAPISVSLAKPGTDRLTGKTVSRALELEGFGATLVE